MGQKEKRERRQERVPESMRDGGDGVARESKGGEVDLVPHRVVLEVVRLDQDILDVRKKERTGENGEWKWKEEEERRGKKSRKGRGKERRKEERGENRMKREEDRPGWH